MAGFVLLSTHFTVLLTLEATMVLLVLMGISLITLFNLCYTQQDAPMRTPNFPWTVPNTSSFSSLDDAFSKYTHSSFNVSTNYDICVIDEKAIPLNDTITDYAPYINEALESLKETGGTVRLMKGSYPISSQIKMVSHSCLLGAGMHKTILVVTDAAVFDAAGGVIMSESGERISLIGFVSYTPLFLRASINFFYFSFSRNAVPAS